uniref:NADH-ubiquinone oxidoreductase chain 4 n=1 Tax=Brachionus koreanus TaxID=1199090 RepID=R4J945_9BILA|nr:NADH dehydrogenase subunit 4 [Brachionus koreanus]
MSFLLVISFFTLFFGTNPFLFITLMVGFWFYFQLSHLSYFVSNLNFLYFCDELSFFMVYMTVFVLFTSFMYSLYLQPGLKINMVYILMLVFCVGVFTTSNLFSFIFIYECSLLPILYIIIKWGSYPERSMSAVMLLVYTSVFTFPFIAVMFTIYSLLGSFLFMAPFTAQSFNVGPLMSIIIFFTFSVKLPIYGLHFWLPMAHVEAPTFGSMILAGILLKLGGVGLIRCTDYMDVVFLKDTLFGYLMVFLVYSTLVCAFQSDFKRLVAYSSVSHMMAVPLLYLSNTIISLKSLLMIMLFHGLSSPVLFMIVGVLYSMFSTRQLIMIRGIMLLSPLLSFLMIVAFFFTMSAPPFPSFVAEVYFMISCFYISPMLLYSFLFFTFLSLVYNLNWLTSMIFSSSTSSTLTFNLTFSSFMPLVLSFFFCIPLSLLFYMM